MTKIFIGKRAIGSDEPTYVIAEAGVNHNGSLARAKELIRKAAEAGADAIKFQTYTAGKLVTKTAPRFWDWKGEEIKKALNTTPILSSTNFPSNTIQNLLKPAENATLNLSQLLLMRKVRMRWSNSE